MKQRIFSNECNISDALARLLKPKQAIKRTMLFSALSFTFCWVPLTQAQQVKQKNIHENQLVVSNEVRLSNPSKHCVNAIEVKSEHLFMRDEWQTIAEFKTKARWAESVKKRYGSVYSQWKDANNKKYECRRIGFGNDKEGNVGTSVLCMIAAEPCVILLNK